jgi:hypothetical protein
VSVVEEEQPRTDPRIVVDRDVEVDNRRDRLRFIAIARTMS